MKTFLLFVVIHLGDGYEQLDKASDMQFSSMAECQAELNHYKDTDEVKFFCGEADLYFNKEQVFY